MRSIPRTLLFLLLTFVTTAGAETPIFTYTDVDVFAHVSNYVGNGPLASAVVSGPQGNGKTNARGDASFSFTETEAVYYGESYYAYENICATKFDFFPGCTSIDIFIYGYSTYWSESQNVSIQLNSVSNFLRGLYIGSRAQFISAYDLNYYQQLVSKKSTGMKNVAFSVLDTAQARFIRAIWFLNYFEIPYSTNIITNIQNDYLKNKSPEDEKVYVEVLNAHGINSNLLQSTGYREYLIQNVSQSFLGRPVSGLKELNEHLAKLAGGETARNLIIDYVTSAEFLSKVYPAGP
jgi:hypothetical protein